MDESRIITGDALQVLSEYPDRTFRCCVTSPPYWGLRDYGIPNQIGAESEFSTYFEHLRLVFREVRRVLTDDGTLWLNIGDGYTSGNRTWRDADKKNRARGMSYRPPTPPGLKPKDLLGVPWRLAFALQQPYHAGVIKRAEDRAWLAAMLDSDGSLGIRVQKARIGRCQNETFIPYLGISQTDTAALEHCVRITGLGNVRVKHEPSNDARGIRSRRTFYTWRLDGQGASRVIRDVYPYLLIKRAQAQVVYAMNESLRWGRPTRTLPVPAKVMEERRRLYETIKRLNQRDPVDLPPMPEVEPAMESGWYLRSDIVWYKPNAQPESVKDRPSRAHEYLFLFSKSQDYFYDYEAMQEPAIQNGKPNGKYRNRRTVWSVNTEPLSDAHFATFPPSLISPCMLAGTQAGDVVLDPFFGSGTVGVVARALGRRYVGIELNPTYVEIAERRLSGKEEYSLERPGGYQPRLLAEVPGDNAGGADLVLQAPGDDPSAVPATGAGADGCGAAGHYRS